MSTEMRYDEFGMYREIAQEWGLPFEGLPTVRRVDIKVAPGQRVSAIKWGTEPPGLVLLHGGGQNAHTWDTLCLALGRPVLAIDLPGHGHSDWRDDRDYWPWSNAEAVATVLDQLAVRPAAVVGMSLGGLTAIRLGSIRPDLTPKLVIVDVSPSVNSRAIEMTLEERGSTALVGGPKVYDTFDEMVLATVALSPNRPPTAIRRGVLHNSMPLGDGRWRWRYDIGSPPDQDVAASQRPRRDFQELWNDVDVLRQPLLLIRGGDSKFVLDEHEEEFRRRKLEVNVAVVPDAGHAIQSDQPLLLRGLIETFVFSDVS